jgi:hypothetical protein
MSDRLFDRETLLDVSVNVIPLGILLFFVVTYALVGDYPADTLVFTVQMSIIGLTGLGLLVLTCYSGKAIASAERRNEGSEALVDAESE